MNKIEALIIIIHLIIMLYEVYCNDMFFVALHVFIICIIEAYRKMRHT